MSMSKKHYVRLAEELRIERNDLWARVGGDPHAIEAFDAAVSIVMDALKRDNMNFDRGRFIDAMTKDSAVEWTRWARGSTR